MICPECDGEYERIGLHWSQSSCDYPNLTDFQHNVVTGLLMGDGYISHQGENPYLGSQMTNREYLMYLDDVFGLCSNGVSFHVSGEQMKEYNQKSDFCQYESSGNYSDQYQFRTKSLPDIIEYSDWYSGEEKVIPVDIDLSPTTLSHWYVCDGSLTNKGYISIAITDEADREDKIRSWFDDTPVSIGWVSESKNRYGNKKIDIRFDKEETRALFDYMSSGVEETPIPGFEYKWPE